MKVKKLILKANKFSIPFRLNKIFRSEKQLRNHPRNPADKFFSAIFMSSSVGKEAKKPFLKAVFPSKN